MNNEVTKFIDEEGVNFRYILFLLLQFRRKSIFKLFQTRLIGVFVTALKEKGIERADIRDLERSGGIGSDGQQIISNLNVMGVELGCV